MLGWICETKRARRHDRVLMGGRGGSRYHDISRMTLLHPALPEEMGKCRFPFVHCGYTVKVGETSIVAVCFPLGLVIDQHGLGRDGPFRCEDQDYATVLSPCALVVLTSSEWIGWFDHAMLELSADFSLWRRSCTGMVDWALTVPTRQGNFGAIIRISYRSCSHQASFSPSCGLWSFPRL